MSVVSIDYAVARRDPPTLTQLAELAVGSLPSPSSRRNYARYIRLFLASGLPLSREGVQVWLISLERMGAGPVTRNVALAAVRLLAREANLHGVLSDQTLYALERIRGVKRTGERLGNWLDVEAVRLLLDSAWTRRDAALIACLCGCALRRREVSGLLWSQWQQRDGRYVWVDIKGKGGRVRSIPAPLWAAECINAWRDLSADKQRVFPIGHDAVYAAVCVVARRAGLDSVRPHDLRRTAAKLMLKGGASVIQIQKILGHASVQTTERYLGQDLELAPGKAATDVIVLPAPQPRTPPKTS